jgi:hypothetical protein
MAREFKSDRLADAVRSASRAALETLAAVLPVYWSMAQLGAWWSPPLDAVVFAVILAVGLPRAIALFRPSELPSAAAALMLGSAVAVAVAMLLSADGAAEWLGAGVFAVAVAVPVWLRRFGGVWRRTGAVAALPLLAVLVHPQAVAASWSFIGWMLAAAAVAFIWCAVLQTLIRPEPPARFDGSVPASRRPRPGLAASTRMALQLAVAVAAAFVAGHWIDSEHLVWPVMTAIIVHSANRGRGDVLVKGTERTIGAAAGTLVATLFAGILEPGDTIALVVVFAALVLSAGLGTIGYAYRAACTTAALAFFYGYFQHTTPALLGDRLLGILAGAAIGIGAAWLILPVRTTDVARLRIAATLAAAAGIASAAGSGTADVEAITRLRGAIRDTEALLSTLRAAGRFGIGPARRLHRAATEACAFAREAIDAATSPIPDPARISILRESINRARRDQQHPPATVVRGG